MRRLPRLFVLGIATFSLSSCGYRYHLSGHHQGNLQNPPDVHLKVGQSSLAISEGFSIKDLAGAFAMIRIEDEKVAKIPLDLDDCVITGVGVGMTKAKYLLADEPNKGFNIIVTP